MRLALFSNTIDAGDGYGNITLELATHVSAEGVDVMLFLPKSQKYLAESLKLPFLIRCVLPEYVYRIYQPEGWKYARRIDVSGFDIVHDLFSFPYCVIAQRSAQKYGKPFMMGAQGTYGVRPLTFYPERWLLKHCYKKAQHLIVPSRYTKEKICEYAGVTYPIDIIHNGVNFERFQREADAVAIRKKYRGKKILLTVGGLCGRKGHDLVLRALPRVLKEFPETAYVVVGAGNSREHLNTLAAELGIRNAVDFVGTKRDDELVSYFHACDIYVHTPRVIDLKFEGFGIVYLEASACGKPIVATDAGGVRNAVLDGITGLIAREDDVDGISNHILRLLRDDALALQLGRAGREYARQNDWKCIAKQFLNLYSRLHA